MKRLLIFSILCALISVPLFAQNQSQEQIIQEMASAAREIRTVRCNFKQTKHMKMLREGQVSEGRMFCQQPDKLVWEYLSPRQETISTDAEAWKGAMARMIMKLVAGQALTDSKAFQVTVKQIPGKYEATLIPLRKDLKRLYTKLVLHYDLKQATVTQVEMYEKTGDRTLIELFDIQINED